MYISNLRTQVSYGLGLDLSRKQQKQLTAAQATVTKLAPRVILPDVKKKIVSKYEKAKAIVSRYTVLPTPSAAITGTPPTTIQPSTTTQTPVWIDPVTALPSSPSYTESGGGSLTTPAEIATVVSSDSVVEGVPNAYLMLGAIALFMMFKRS